MRIRKNAANHTTSERQELIAAFKALKTKMVNLPNVAPISHYDLFAVIHLGVTRKIKDGQVLSGPARNGGHQNAAFLPWHREFLLRVERELQIVADNLDLSIPYWDWSDHDGTSNEIFIEEFMGGDGAGSDVTITLNGNEVVIGRKVVAGHFSKENGWPIDPRAHYYRAHLDEQLGDELVRSLRGSDQLPEQQQINSLFDLHDYEVFRAQLEGGDRMHNAMHVWVSGTMLTHASPADPIFMLNHANVDRLWALWQSDGHAGEDHYPSADEPAGHNLEDSM